MNKALDSKKMSEQWKIEIPEEYHEFLGLFSENLAGTLPSHHTYHHNLTLKDRSEPPFKALYVMCRDELEPLQKSIKVYLSNGFIPAGSPQAGWPVSFQKRSNAELRFCLDYRDSNKMMIKSGYRLPLIQEIFSRIPKAEWHTNLDICAAYNLIRVVEGDEWKTASMCSQGHFEYLVMAVGRTNSPATFQTFIIDIVQQFLGVFFAAHFDDILIS